MPDSPKGHNGPCGSIGRKQKNSDRQATGMIGRSTISSDIASIPGTWFAAFVTECRERQFAERLHALEIPAYCPMEPSRSQRHRGKWVETKKPLFPSYVFFAAADFVPLQWSEVINAATSTHMMTKLIPIADQKKFVRELSGVQRAIEVDPTARIFREIAIGTSVRIVRPHPLAGVQGTVIEHRHDKGRIVLSVLGSPVMEVFAPCSPLFESVDIEVDQVESITA